MKKMKKLTKQDAENLENLLKTAKMANDALLNGFGPAHNSDKAYAAIPGHIEDSALIGKGYYAIIVEKDENGIRPVDWYSWSPKPGFISGFGGWYKYDYDWFIKENPWVKAEWDSLMK